MCGRAVAVHPQKRPDRSSWSRRPYCPSACPLPARRQRHLCRKPWRRPWSWRPWIQQHQHAARCPLVAFAASPPPGQRFLFRSAIQSSDQGRAQAASAPSCQWVVDGLPAPKQPKQPSREILDHSRRFIPNPVRPFPSQDSSRAIPNTSTLHLSFLSLRVRAWHTAAQLPHPTAKRQGHENHTRPPILLATLSLHTHTIHLRPPNGAREKQHARPATAKKRSRTKKHRKAKKKRSHNEVRTFRHEPSPLPFPLSLGLVCLPAWPPSHPRSRRSVWSRWLAHPPSHSLPHGSPSN